MTVFDELEEMLGQEYKLDNQVYTYSQLLNLAAEQGMVYGNPIQYLREKGYRIIKLPTQSHE